MTQTIAKSQIPAALQGAIHTKLFIDGKFVDAESGETMATLNPHDNSEIAQIALAGKADVDKAIQAAQKAYPKWSRLAAMDRGRILLKLADLIEANAEQLAMLESLDTGHPIRDSRILDVPRTAVTYRYFGGMADKFQGDVVPVEAGFLNYVTREPLGVVGQVVPWNFPLMFTSWKMAPALAAGNCVVLKPAEQSPLSALRLAELALEAGLPEGTLNVVTGQGETTGAAVGLHQDIDVLTFTGSTQVGKYFMKYSGESNMKQVWLECGGKSPNLVFADTSNLDEAAEFAARAIFFNQGEVCSANSRLLVEKSIAEHFTELVIEQAKKIQLGNPLDPATTMGPLVDRNQTGRVAEFISSGTETARLAHGGSRLTIDGSDCYVEPTVFTNVAAQSSISIDEIFGPVLSIMSFESEAEAISLANDSIYGLAASVWTSNLSRAHRVSDALHAGTVSVNTVDALGMNIPFGGFKQSGFGRDLSLHAMEKYTGLKTTWIRYE